MFYQTIKYIPTYRYIYIELHLFILKIITISITVKNNYSAGGRLIEMKSEKSLELND